MVWPGSFGHSVAHQLPCCCCSSSSSSSSSSYSYYIYAHHSCRGRGKKMEGEQQKASKVAEKKAEEELPLENSPYVKYSDVEEYKEKGYGTHGHQQPVDNRRTGGATDGPTLSGGGLTQAQVKTAEAVNRCGAV